MTSTIQTFLDSRESDIKRQIADLRAELAEIKAARDGIANANMQKPAPTASLNQRDMMEAVLNENPEGGLAHQVVEWVRERFNAEVGENSVSPQLSRLRKEGRAVWDQKTKIWRSAKHATPKENASPNEGEADTGGVTAPSVERQQLFG